MLPNVIMRMNQSALCSLVSRQVKSLSSINQGKSEGISETKKETALRMLKRGKMTIEEIAEDAGLSVSEAEQLAGLQTV